MSDTAAPAPDGALKEQPSFLRSYGESPRALQRSERDRHVLPLSEADLHITSWPAEYVGPVDGGRLKLGLLAGVTVFDLERIGSRFTLCWPRIDPGGIGQVMAKGPLTMEAGFRTDGDADRLLCELQP